MKEKKTVQIKVIQNGPLQVTGEIRMIGIDGNKIKKEGDIFLCRCGNSESKPFCDGSHKKKGFRE